MCGSRVRKLVDGTRRAKDPKLTTLLHELVGKTESTIGTENADACDVSMRNAIGWLLFHLAENISNHPPLFVLGNVRELWPGERVVKVVSQCVVLGKIVQVAVLHAQEVIDLSLEKRAPSANKDWCDQPTVGQILFGDRLGEHVP